MNRVELVIDGIPVTDLHRYVIRWAQGPAGWLSDLYCDGKRVTKAWRITLLADMGADEHGGNANTA